MSVRLLDLPRFFNLGTFGPDPKIPFSCDATLPFFARRGPHLTSPNVCRTKMERLVERLAARNKIPRPALHFALVHPFVDTR